MCGLNKTKIQQVTEWVQRSCRCELIDSEINENIRTLTMRANLKNLNGYKKYSTLKIVQRSVAIAPRNELVERGKFPGRGI